MFSGDSPPPHRISRFHQWLPSQLNKADKGGERSAMGFGTKRSHCLIDFKNNESYLGGTKKKKKNGELKIKGAYVALNNV